MSKMRTICTGSLFCRTLGLLLALVLTLALGPGGARAASWVDPYLEQVTAWGVMKGDADGKLHPERSITRAEFVTMLNRALGYTEEGPNPFSDVPQNAWYRQSICIARKAGYFSGTGPSTASPEQQVTREQAVVMLGRALRLQDQPGVSTRFHDNTQISGWARGCVQTASDMGIIGGFPDGTFRPQASITRGETAAMLVSALGNLISQPGTHELGGVYGNLTITTPEVELRNTVVTGNLYLTGGVGLEALTLENVTVLGEIVICGAGNSQKGQSSVILRNVNADSLVVDTLQDYPVSVRAEGLTEIDRTTVRSSSFLEDMTGRDLGLKLVQLEGDRQVDLRLAGSIKEVINRAPGSDLIIAQGSAQKITVDEHALDAELRVDRYVSVEQTNLDIPTSVTGQGSLGHVNISAPDCKVEMLPDTIVVRPGISADVSGEDMDSVTAEESSQDPRILGGYPALRNVAPTSAEAVFSTNKKGTLRWALTPMTDGSLSAEELLNPASVAHKVLKSGTLEVKASHTEQMVKLTGLTRDGSYYLSALLTDSRGRHSQVKVAALTTPDDSLPAFAPGYPQPILTKDKDGRIIVQTRVMATKSCRLYYALMPKGSVAPTPADFRAAALTGTLGWGQMDVLKNTPHMLSRVNEAALKEKTDYDLYLMLSDVDNGKNSPVKKLTITTPDITPPKLQRLTVSNITDTSVALDFQINEPGTLYWAVVRVNQKFLEDAAMGEVPSLDDMIHIENGSGALKKGSAKAAAKSLDGRFTVTGLEPQATYHLYYVVKDTAGNYGIYTAPLIPPMEIKTLDTQPPTVAQEFTHDGSPAGAAHPTPYPDTSIRLVFSEPIQGVHDVDGRQETVNFMKLFLEGRTDELAESLARHITLWRKPLRGQPEAVPPRDAANASGDWLVDYRRAKLESNPDTGEMILVLPYNSKELLSGLNLASGTTYYFELTGIADTATPFNRMKGERGIIRLPEFTTIDAQMIFSKGSATGVDKDSQQPLVFDMSFTISPVTAASVSDEIVWDLLFWSEDRMAIEVYSKNKSEEAWTLLKNPDSASTDFKPTSLEPKVGLSLTRELLTSTAGKYNPGFEQLNQMEEDREYGIIVRQLDGSDYRDQWSGTVNIEIMAVSGDQGSMSHLVNKSLTPASFEEHQQTEEKVKQIGVPEVYKVSCPFRDKTSPQFINGYPLFHPGDTSVQMDILLSRGNTKFFYVITEAGNIPTTLVDDSGSTTEITRDNWDLLPEAGRDMTAKQLASGNVSLPVANDITNPVYQGAYVTGHGTTDGSVKSLLLERKLQPQTRYVAYFVLQGESPESMSSVFAFRFETEEVVRPILNVGLISKTAATISSRDKTGQPQEADVRYMMVVSGAEGSLLNETMTSHWRDNPLYPLDPSLASQYKSMTLLEAMATAHSIGGKSQGSVFDLFSDNQIQETLTGAFNSASTDGTTIMKVGDVKLVFNPDSDLSCLTTVECRDAMKEGKQRYWFLAMGKSPLGSGSAFAATRYMEWPDTKGLQVTTISTERDHSSKIYDNYADASDNAYSGQVTLTFNQGLYYNNGRTILQVVDAKLDLLPPLDQSKYCLSKFLISGGDNVEILPQYPAGDRGQVSALRLKFTGVMPGRIITFRDGLGTSTGFLQDVPLTLKLDLVKNAEGFYEPVFVITTPVWEAGMN